MSLLPYSRQLIEDDDIEEVVAALRSDWLTTGPALERFERDLAAAVDAPYAAAVSNGTAALHAACAALGLGPGDEAIVPAITFVATASAVLFCGATPVFADVDPGTGLLRPEDVARRVTPRTRAILPVHLCGVPVQLDGIADAAPGVPVLEDAAHALGATDVGGHAVGGCRQAALAIFSFHPVKHVTTGEGGAVTTRDPELDRRVRAFRGHGIERDPTRLEVAPGPWWYEQQSLGHNFRMCELQAALGISQLRKVERFLGRRRALAARYDAALAGLPGVRPLTAARERSAVHLYPVAIAWRRPRQEVMARLRARGVGSQVHYIPVPMQPIHRARWDMAEFPGARTWYEHTLSLPLFPGMADADVDRVVEALTDAL